MTLAPLYRVRFEYSQGWHVAFAPPPSAEGQHFFLATGICEGRITGAFKGANHPRRRGDGTFEPNMQGVIETTDGATIFFDHRGYGRAYPAGRRQIVIAGTHVCSDERYKWLNDSIAVGAGEVRVREGQPSEVVVEWSEVVWEPLTC